MRFGLGLDLTSAEAAPSGDEPPTLTFSTGLTRVANTITANLSTGIAGSQSVVGGTAASETLTLSSTAHATKGKILFGTAAYDEVNNYLGIGTVSPSSKIDITTNSLGTTQANTSGLSLVNTTAAAAGAQQISPALRLQGQGWKTNATAASQPVDFRIDVLPVQGAAAPTGSLRIQSSINGGTYTDLLSLSSGGSLTLSQAASGLTIGSAGVIAANIFQSTNFAASLNYAGYTQAIYTPNGVLGSSALNLFNITQTWNTTGNPTLFFANVNNTASGATANLMDLQVGGGSLFKIGKGGNIDVAKTITTPGTTGNQTINKIAGTVNIAAAGTTVTVTNSLVTANSIIMCTVQTNDTTAVIKNAIPAAGSFVINLNTAATAETAVSFFIIN